MTGLHSPLRAETDAIVADLKREGFPALARAYPGMPGLCVSCHIGQPLTDGSHDLLIMGGWHQRKCCQVALAGNACRAAEALDFLLDCLYCDDHTVRRLATDRLARQIGRPIEIDPDADPDERALAIQQVRATLRSASKPATRPALNRS